MADYNSMQDTNDNPPVSEARKALVKRVLNDVTEAKKHWKKNFDRMRKWMKFAEGNHWPNQREDDERVQVDIIQRHVDSRTASLYMRNPTMTAKRKPKLDFAIWDGKQESLMQLYQRLTTSPMPMPSDVALLQDIAQGMQRRKLIDNMGRTLEILMAHTLDEQQPPFKSSAKQLIPRVLTCGVAYVRTGYQRQLKKRPETQAALHDVTSQLATLERLRSEILEGELDTYKADYEQAMLLRAALEADPEIVVREGIVYTFPCSTRIIPDKKCRNLDGFVGSNWVAEEHPMTACEIEETYGVDVKGKATGYTMSSDGRTKPTGDGKQADVYCVFEVFHKKDGLVYVVVDGYDDFLQEPAAPEEKFEAFWTIRALVFNRVESESNPFPKSDIGRLMSLQIEINRTMESLRQHRWASRPLYAIPGGVFEDDDKKSLRDHQAHDVIEFSVPPDTDINKVIQQLKKTNIDPNVYALDPVYDAILRVSGQQEANLGGTSNSSATESSIAEASRISSLSSNSDDLDDFLSGLTKDAGQLHMRETSKETVMRIVGIGAVWPDMPVQDIMDELYLTTRAASTGRPNRDRELANFERASPILLQLPGIKPEKLAEMFMRVLDDSMELADFYDPAVPSITQMNGAKQLGTGDPATDPNQQGPAGTQNGQKPMLGAPGGQPSYQQDYNVDSADQQ